MSTNDLGHISLCKRAPFGRVRGITLPITRIDTSLDPESECVNVTPVYVATKPLVGHWEVCSVTLSTKALGGLPAWTLFLEQRTTIHGLLAGESISFTGVRWN